MLQEAVTLVAMLSAENIFTPNSSSNTEHESRYRHFAHINGDHLTLLEVWRAYEAVRAGTTTQSGGVAAWCRTNSINEWSMKKAADVRKQLVMLCERKGVSLTSCGDELDAVRKCLTAGLFLNCASRSDGGEYVTLMDRQTVSIHPSSVLKQASKKPSHLVYSEVWILAICSTCVALLSNAVLLVC